MKRSDHNNLLVLGAMMSGGALALLAPAARADVLMYELHDLGTLGGPNTMALGINESGTVVGWSEIPSAIGPIERHAFYWTVEEGMVDLGTLGGTWAEARAINASGVIVGASTTAEGSLHAFVSFDGDLYDLNVVLGPSIRRRAFEDPTIPSIPMGPPSVAWACRAPFEELVEAVAINDAGFIVGCGFIGVDQDLHGFLLIPKADGADLAYTIVDLGELPWASDCVPYGLNDAGQVVGQSGEQAFLWESGQIAPLDGYARLVYFQSAARAINESGVAGGWFENAGMRTACLWAEGFRIDRGYLPGWQSAILGLNDGELAVGWAQLTAAAPIDLPRIAVLWDGSAAIDLNQVTAIPLADLPGFPWSRLEQATGIDNTERIAGFGRSLDGRTRAFLLTPIQQAP